MRKLLLIMLIISPSIGMTCGGGMTGKDLLALCRGNMDMQLTKLTPELQILRCNTMLQSHANGAYHQAKNKIMKSLKFAYLKSLKGNTQTS